MLNSLSLDLLFCLVESWPIYHIITLGNKWEWLYSKKCLKENWYFIPMFTFMLLISQMSDIVLKETWEIFFLLYRECHISMHRKPGYVRGTRRMMHWWLQNEMFLLHPWIYKTLDYLHKFYITFAKDCVMEGGRSYGVPLLTSMNI